MFEKITIIGDGAMASVCAMMLCDKGLDVTMWGYDAEQLARIAGKRENVKFLPGHKLPDSLKFEAADEKAMVDAELLVSAVPCQFTRSIWQRLKEYTPDGLPIVSVTKGIEMIRCSAPRRYFPMYSGMGINTPLFPDRR